MYVLPTCFRSIPARLNLPGCQALALARPPPPLLPTTFFRRVVGLVGSSPGMRPSEWAGSHATSSWPPHIAPHGTCLRETLLSHHAPSPPFLWPRAPATREQIREPQLGRIATSGHHDLTHVTCLPSQGRRRGREAGQASDKQAARTTGVFLTLRCISCNENNVPPAMLVLDSLASANMTCKGLVEALLFSARRLVRHRILFFIFPSKKKKKPHAGLTGDSCSSVDPPLQQSCHAGSR